MRDPLFRVLAFRTYAAASTILLVPLAIYLLWISPLLGLGFIVATLIVLRIFGRYRIPEECFSEIIEDYVKAGKNLAKTELNYANIQRRLAPSSDEHETKIKFKRSTRGIRAKKPFLYIKCDSSRFIATNKTYWFKFEGNTLSGNTADIRMEEFHYHKLVDDPRSDDEVVESIWEHATKNGERDWRFKDNKEMYRVQRKGLTLQIGGFDLDFHLFSIGAREEFSESLQTLLNNSAAQDDTGIEIDLHDPEEDDAEEIENEDEGEFDEQGYYDEAWPAILNIEPNATIDDITTSYLTLMEQYNPEHVAHLGEKLRSTADEESEALKSAYRAALRSRGVSI